MVRRVSLNSLWLGAGWLGVAAVVYFTLVPDPPKLDIEQGDKVQHLVAYASLMLWFAQVHTTQTQQRMTALLLVAMGITLEFAQGLTGYRFISTADMAANAAGVGAGWLAASPRLPNAFAWVSNLFSRRR